MKAGYLSNLSVRLAALLIIYSTNCCYSRAQANGSTSLPEGPIRDVAERILKKADKANCKPRDCRIAVANFTFASGLTSQLGVALADQLSQVLASQQNAIPVIDRLQLRSDLERQRIPGELLNNEEAARWLGQAVGATAILTGTIEQSASSVRVKAHLMSCRNEKAGPAESLTFSYIGPASDLSPAEAFTKQLPSIDISSSPAILEAGKGGVKQPSCVYCPDPNYTDPARKAKASGTVIMELVISEQGQVVRARIVRGAPFGMNEASMDTVRSWKLKPATLDGRPVTAAVNVEVMFKLILEKKLVQAQCFWAGLRKL